MENLNSKLKKWIGYHFSTGSFTGEDFRKFEREMRLDLKRQADKQGMDVVGFTKGHYWFSAVLKDRASGKFAYVSISDVRFFYDEWTDHTLYRSMKHERDYSGGSNHFCDWKDVGESVATLLRAS